MKSVELKVSPVSDYYINSPSITAQEMFLYPLQCGVFTYEPGYHLTRSSFDSFLLMYIQENAVKKQVAGMSAAMAVILGLCIMLVSFLQMRVMRSNAPD